MTILLVLGSLLLLAMLIVATRVNFRCNKEMGDYLQKVRLRKETLTPEELAAFCKLRKRLWRYEVVRAIPVSFGAVLSFYAWQSGRGHNLPFLLVLLAIPAGIALQLYLYYILSYRWLRLPQEAENAKSGAADAAPLDTKKP